MGNPDDSQPAVPTEKKRQHYVPRCYLSQFSLQGDEVRIGIFVLPGEKFIPAGALSKQAYENFFYGKDGFIENALEKVEGPAGPILKRIAQERTLPTLNPQERESLLAFIAIFGLRTKGAIEENEVVFSKGLTTALGSGAEAAAKQSGGREAAILASLKTALKLLPLYRDLGWKLLVNDTSVPFITSDNPLIKYNQFLEQRTSLQYLGSLNHRGIQLFVPISSVTCLMLYDSAVYGVGSRDQDQVFVQPQDALQLNRLQAAAAECCVYFDHTVDEQLVSAIAREAKGFRRPEQGTERFEADGRTVIRLFRTSLRAKLELSFVKVLRRARRWDLADDSNLVRHREFEEALAEATRRVRPSLSGVDETGKPVTLTAVPPSDIRSRKDAPRT